MNDRTDNSNISRGGLNSARRRAPQDVGRLATDFYLEIQRGNIAGMSIIHKFGRHPNVPNGTFEKIEVLASNPDFLSVPTTVRIKAGGNANDTAAGTKARSVEVTGIDSNLNEISETIATAGASASSATTASFWRIHRARVIDAGTYGVKNEGDIMIEDSAGTADIMGMLAESGQSQHGAFTIPTGFTGFYLSSLVTIDANKSADFMLLTRDNFNDTVAPMPAINIKQFFDGLVGPTSFKPQSPALVLDALTDIWFEARGAGAITEVSADFEILLIAD